MARPSVRRRLRALNSQLVPAAAAAHAGGGAPSADSGKKQQWLPPPQPGPGGQGFGPRSTQAPRRFHPLRETAAAAAFFEENGYACLGPVLSAAQIARLHAFFDASQAADPQAWSIYEPAQAAFGAAGAEGRKRGMKAKLAQVLVETDELDWCARLPTLLPFVERLLGEGNARYAELNFRETPANSPPGQMGFHHVLSTAALFPAGPRVLKKKLPRAG
eukprot:COSAG04_NODE_4795_length_1890_cov_1.524846_3_plen_218_part_00